ncbi:MAG: lamin tail domain-containing protein [Verrucomicrobiales bacterium]
MRVAQRTCLYLFTIILAMTARMAAADLAEDPFELSQIEPPAGAGVQALHTVEISFSRDVTGVDASDLLINNQPATNVLLVAERQYLFSFTQPSLGPVQVAWAPLHEIKDLNGDAFPAAGWSYTLQEAAEIPPIQISEFLASNQRGLRDKDGETSDWIELYNPTDDEVTLTDWFLTDTAAKLTLWRFPEVTIKGRGYLVVFASEKNLVDPAGQLHTNFKLSDGGEYLALVSPQTNVVSAFAPSFPKQTSDVSYGRIQSDPNVLGFFTKPTPGTLNSTRGVGFAPDVLFSHGSGPFTNTFALTLTTTSPLAVIRYTVNGTAPTNNSPIYTSPLTIRTNVQVRARSYQTGLLPGPIQTHAFTSMSNNMRGFTSSLPVLVITTFGRSPTSSSQTSAHLSLFEPEAGWTSLTNKPTLTTRAAVKLRGSSTETMPKSSYALEIWDELNLDKDISVLGLPEDSDWVLYAPNQFDPVMIHNPFIHQLSRDSGMYSSRTRFVEVYVHRLNGVMSSNAYNGIYVLEEKIKIGNDRVDIDKLQPQHTTLPDITGGYLMKFDRLDPGDSGIAAGGARVALIDPKESELRTSARRAQQQYLTTYLNDFSRALTSVNWRDPKVGYPAFINVENWIDFHTLEVLSGNVDTLVLSTYFYKPRNGKLAFGPHWDFDRALGSTDGRDANPRVWSTGPFFSAPWWNKLFTDRDFWQLWVDKWQERRTSYFSNTNVNRLIDELSAQLVEAQPREQKRWGTRPRGGSYQGEVNLMKSWLSNRMDFIDKQLAVPPRISSGSRKIEPGFRLEMTAPANNIIYYTLDGSDPRLPQGNISSRAILYTGPVEITSNSLVVARTRNTIVRQNGGPPVTTPWSRPIKTTLYFSTSQVVVSELMFHPEEPLSGSRYAAEDYQFLELKNNDSQVVHLPGYTFQEGISFTFSTNGIQTLAPGGRVLVVKNKAAFLERYPNIDPNLIAGEFSGSLAFAGETISLTGSLGEPIFAFAYSDEWHKATDGFGFSLTLANESALPPELGRSSTWRVSASSGGSPGVADPAPPLVHPVYISEVLSNPSGSGVDTVELMNPNPHEVNISGWWLSDDLREPKKYRFPAGTVIASSGYLLVRATQFNNASATSFGLSADGDEVYLFSADATGALTGFQHGWEFGATSGGETYGLYISPGGFHSASPQQTATLGQANGLPKVGPIVINEIMYHPLGNYPGHEYIEIKNISSQPVQLYDPSRPTNVWKITGDIDFAFPQNSVIPPQGVALILSFDPRHFGLIHQFRSSVGLIDDPLVFGPWTGALNNSGGILEIQRPGVPVVSGEVVEIPMHLVEAVAFSPAAPWPAGVEGTGYSLGRLREGAHGNDETNWTAVKPSPGDVDADADGLPDAWERSNGLDPQSAAADQSGSGDLDGDGLSNFDELKTGTSPTDPASTLGLQYKLTTPRDLELSFTPVIGRAYAVYYSDTLQPNSWALLKSYPAATSTNAILIKERPKARYYKLMIP